MRSFLATGLLAAALSVATPPALRSQPHHVLKMATTAAEGSPLVRQMQRLAAIIEERTAGVILVKLFPAGRLGADKTLIEQLQSGAIQIYGGDLEALGQTVSPLQLLRAPYVFRSYAHADACFDGPLKQPLSEALASHRMEFGTYGPSVFERWFSNAAPPRTSRALTGVSLQRAKSEGERLAWQALGASQIASPGVKREAPWLFRSSTVLATATGQAHLATHVTRSQDVLASQLIVLSQRWLAGLPERFQDAVRRLPEDPSEQARGEARALDDELARRLGAQGKQLGRLEEAERNAFAEIAERANQRRAKGLGRHAQALFGATR